MLPMQRITRLPLLIDAIFTRLDSNSSEFEVCREALEIINKVCTVVEIYTCSIPHKKHRIRKTENGLVQFLSVVTNRLALFIDVRN